MVYHSEQTVFLVDDDLQVCNILERILKNQLDVHVVSFTEGCKCLESIQCGMCDLLISSTSTIGMDGIDLSRRTKRMFPALPIIIISDTNDTKIAVDAMKTGAFDFCLKPLERTQFLRVVEQALSLSSDLQASSSAALTSAEQELLCLVLTGGSLKETAGIFSHSTGTTEVQLRSIMKKLGVNSLFDLIVRFGIMRYPYYLES